MRIKFVALAIASAALLSPVAAIAEAYRDSKNNIYISGTELDSGKVTLGLGGNYTRRIRVGFCGEIAISPSSSIPNPGNTFAVGAQVFNAASLPVDDDARCTNAVLQNAPASGGWRTSTGKVVLLGSPAFSPGVSLAVEYRDVPNTLVRRPNNCGFVRLTNSPTRPLPPTITINGTSVTIATLPLVNPPRCFPSETEPGAYVLYTPPL